MPAILIQILRMLAGFGAAGLATKGATKYLLPVASKAIGRFAPSLVGGKLGKVGEGALKFGTGMAGFGAGSVAFDAVTGAAMGASGGEPPPDDTVDDVLGRMNQPMPFQREQQAGLQRIYQEAEVREALEAMGIDFDDFAELAGSRQVGGLV